MAITNSSSTDYYYNNYLGSVQSITNESGTLEWSRDYYPFGQDKEAFGAIYTNSFKFTDKEWDDESDLYYFWHRFYDPEIGRFIQIDPMWDKYPSLTPYQYCPIRDSCWSANNPLRYIDPDGQRIMSANQVNTFETVLISSSARWKTEMNSMPI